MCTYICIYISLITKCKVYLYPKGIFECWRHLLKLMHALSTHSHPVTSPLNIETGFSSITDASFSTHTHTHTHTHTALLALIFETSRTTAHTHTHTKACVINLKQLWQQTSQICTLIINRKSWGFTRIDITKQLILSEKTRCLNERETKRASYKVTVINKTVYSFNRQT